MFYTPYIGSQIALYDGVSAWNTITFTQLSIAVPGTTSTIYDFFVYDNSGTATPELQAWTNDTTRNVGLTRQDGVLVKASDATRRYVGSFRTTTIIGQTEDSVVKRYVWNYYNRINRPMSVVDTTNSWTYTIASFRQANANTANQLDCIIGVSEDCIFAQAYGMAGNVTAGVNTSVGIGVDSTTVNSAQTRPSSGVIAGGKTSIAMATYNAPLPAGRHYLPWLELSQASGTTTWQGDGGGSFRQTGITGFLMG